MFLHILNETGDVATVTFVTPKTVDGLAIADRAVAITDAEERMIGPFPPTIYNDADRMVQVTYSVVGAGATVALLRL
jgi:hypothetical protein